MISFAYPWLLLALIIPVLLVVTYVRTQQKQRSAVPFPNLNELKLAHADRMTWQRHLPFLFRMLALTALILATARPQLGEVKVKKSSEGLDIVLALDTSGSMKAMDFEIDGQRQNRLDIVKRVISDFIAKRSSDRIGLVVFGTEAFTQAPLTLDHEVLLQFLKSVSIGMAGENTAIGNAIATGVKRLKDVDAKSKIIILLTDGENTAGSVQPAVAAEAAASLGIKIYTIGVGSNEPVPFPVETWAKTVYTKRRLKLDTELLKSVASVTGGGFFLASDTVELQSIYNKIDQLETTTIEVEEYRDYDERAAPFLIAALVFLALELLLGVSSWRPIP